MENLIYLGTQCIIRDETEFGATYISNASARYNGYVYTESGEGNTLEASKKNAVSNLKKILRESPAIPNEQVEKFRNKDELLGGGNKPSSSSQQDYLHKLAVDLGINLGQYIFQRFAKGIPELMGSEANIAIRELLAQSQK